MLGCILTTPVFADDISEEEKAAEAANKFLEQDGYVVGEAIPTVSLHLLGDEISFKRFSEIKQEISSFAFEFYDENGQIWGSIFVGKEADGTYKVNSGVYGMSQIKSQLSQYDYDEVVLMSDMGDFYFCLKNEEQEMVAPGIFNYAKRNFKTANPSWSISEFFNALEYREKYDPINPDLLGSRGSKPIFNYIGRTERKQMMTTLTTLSAVVLLVGASVTTVLIFKRKRHKNNNLSK